MDPSNTIIIDNYRYHLPDSKIAKYTLANRDQSKLLIYQYGDIKHRTFRELPTIIPSGCWLVFNNTRVIQARLNFRKPSGARIEIFCLEPSQPSDYQQSFESSHGCTWKCLVGNARKWKDGPVSLNVNIGDQHLTLEARIKASSGGDFIIQFSWNNPGINFGEIIENAGSTPIPPYLKREAEVSDKTSYQTIYSKDLGSVAAPTAGLHFTEEVLKRLKEKGVESGEITLHVGAGTFVPVKTTNVRYHAMHAEQVALSRSFLAHWARNTGDLIAVGTTSARSLESLYWLGVKILQDQAIQPGQMNLDQWEHEQLPGHISLAESLQALMAYCNKHQLDQFHFSTRLMIVPGYKFRAVGGLITNFHLPGSTLLLLISAFIGEDWKSVYDYALNNQFRFLSYGDSSLLLPK